MVLDFEKGNGLIPAVVQDATTRKVLMLGYMNQEALDATREKGKVTFFSRSKNRLWTKGETSGNFLQLVEIREDCDKDTLLVLAHPIGPVCHTGADTCFKEENQADISFFNQLSEVIHARKEASPDSSYTAQLFHRGINKIAQKVGEEAVEVIIEAKDEDEDKFLNECADLMFHFLVLLEAKNTSLSAVAQVLAERH
ncbi:MAG: bifunctional phosphoribosyl-AMP cyclohydrolase/phosphoribosyl-ATP diphosphatase HisIE, partial [Bacteroidota bacterium]